MVGGVGYHGDLRLPGENVTKPDLFDYDDHRRYLADWFDFKKREREQQGLPTYSHRMFAAAAGLANVGTLVSVINGDRNLTDTLLSAFRVPLELDAQEAGFLELLARRHELRRELDKARANAVAKAAGPGDAPRPRRRAAVVDEQVKKAELALSAAEADVVGARRMRRAQLLEGARLGLVSVWYNGAILELARCKGFRFDPVWISQAFRGAVTPEQAAASLKGLAERGDLRQGEDGAPLFGDHPYITPDGVTNVRLWDVYRGMFERSYDALLISEHSREFGERCRLGGLTIAVPSSEIPRLREHALEARKQLFQAMEGLHGEADTVYMALVHVFPVTENTGAPLGPAPSPGGGDKKK